MKTSPRNVGDLVFLEYKKTGLNIIIQNNCVKFVADKEFKEASWEISVLTTSLVLAFVVVLIPEPEGL